MRDLDGAVAVITGAARGIGLALARFAAAQGMRIALADSDTEALERARTEIARSARVIAVPTDVSKSEDVERLAAETLRAYGVVNLVCNNAGVGALGRAWEISEQDWAWVLGVNLWGVIHGVRSFVPILLRQGMEGHVVNTASLAGVTSEPGMAPYRASKHAVVALSETLHHDLRGIGAPIGVSVLCPGFVRTTLIDRVRTPSAIAPRDTEALRASAAAGLAAGIEPERVAAAAFEAIRERRFYVFTHPDDLEPVRRRTDDVLTQREPRARRGSSAQRDV